MDYFNAASSRGSAPPAPPASLQHHGGEPSARDVLVPAMVYYMPRDITQNRNPRNVIQTASSENVRKVVIHKFRTDKFRHNNNDESTDYVSVAEFTQHMVMESLIDCILPICGEATRKKKTNVVRLVFGDRHETLVWMVDPENSSSIDLSDIPSIGVELCMLPSSSTADDYSGCLPPLTESDPIWDHAYLAATTTSSSQSSLSDAIFFIRTKDNAPIRRLTSSSKNHATAMTRAIRVWTSPDDPMRLARIETLEYAGDESSTKKKSTASPSKKRSRAKPTTTVKTTTTTGTPVAPQASPPKSPSEDIPEAQVLVMDEEKPAKKKQQKEPLVWKPVMKKWDAPPRGIIQLDFTRDEMDMLAYHYEHDGTTNGDKKAAAAAAAAKEDAADSSAASSSPKKKRKKEKKKKKSSDDKETETAAKKDAASSTPVAPAAAASSPKKKKKKSVDDEDDDTSKAAEKAKSTAAHVDTTAASSSPKKIKSSPARKSLDNMNKPHKKKVAGKSIVVPGSKKEPEAKPAPDKKKKKKKKPSDSESSKSSRKDDEQSDSSDSSSNSSSSSSESD